MDPVKTMITHHIFPSSSSRLRSHREGMGTQERSSMPAIRYRIALSVMPLLFVSTFLLLARRHPPSPLQKPSMTTSIGTKSLVPQLSAKLNIIKGTQIVWQIPAAPKAVLFVAHGCYCRPTFFWDKGPDCPECIGLPEERILVMHALAKQYAIIAIASSRSCWSFLYDKQKVKTLLNHWVKEQSLEKLPLVALGASSGGYFVSALAWELKFAAVVLMISEGAFTTRNVHSSYPPTLFLHMPKDQGRALVIKENMVKLKSKGVETAEVKCYEFPVTPQLFSKIPGLDNTTCEKIYDALKKIGILDHTSFMKVDGRSSSEWQNALKRQQILPLESEGRLKWEAHLRELLNLAYGYHEMTSLQSKQIFEWFDSHLPKTVTSTKIMYV